jgi:ferrochelatase
MKNKVIILVNTGTPDKPEKKYVRKFLSEFLNDPRVIDLPWIIRKLLVDLVIVPFRTGKSTRLYRRLWTPDGSPLLSNMQKLAAKLRVLTGQEYTVTGAMRYGNPSLKDALKKLRYQQVDELVIFPLFPQYASSTTGSVHEYVMKEISRWNNIPETRMTGQFYSHQSFISAFAAQIRKYDTVKYDHVLFSYHSLPLKHIQAVHPALDQTGCICKNHLPGFGTSCYKAVCYETTRLLAGALELPEGKYSTSFQSRFARKWLGPFTDQVLEELAMSGKKKILFVAPSFVADCLETIVEIDEYRDIFRNLGGGEELMLVDSLNDNDDWVKAVIEIIRMSYHGGAGA